MNDTTNARTKATWTAQRVVLMKRIINFSALTAALSALSVAIGMFGRPFEWTGALGGIAVLSCGFQTSTSHRELARLAPAQARLWMTQLAYLMYIVGSVIIGAGILAGIRRFTA